MGIRERFQEVPLLLKLPCEIGQFRNFLFHLYNLTPLHPLERADDLRHFRLLWILHFDWDIKTFRMEIIILIHSNCVWNDDRVGVT
jgi:hypothetical protein